MIHHERRELEFYHFNNSIHLSETLLWICDFSNAFHLHSIKYFFEDKKDPCIAYFRYIVLGSVNLFSEVIVIMTAESVGRIPVGLYVYIGVWCSDAGLTGLGWMISVSWWTSGSVMSSSDTQLNTNLRPEHRTQTIKQINSKSS